LPQSNAGAETHPLVLVVEDERNIRRVSRRFLEGAGYNVLDVDNGRDALAILDDLSQPVEVLIADLVMPGISGEEMARQARARRPDLKVLYVSGHIDRLLDQRALWDDEAFLEKPYTSAALLEAVSLLLHGTVRSRCDG
jgi:CheY-like chemotaxis protein